MESLLMEQSLSPRKHIKTPKRKTHHPLHHHHHQLQQFARLSTNISRQSSLNQNYVPSPPPPNSFVHELDLMMMHGGFFFNNHPSTINTTSSINNTTPYNHIHQYPRSNSLPPMFLHQHLPTATAKRPHQQQQPPLLPLPAVARPSFRSLPPLTRGKSLSSQTPRKSPIKNNKAPQKSKKQADDSNKNNIKEDQLVDKDKKVAKKEASPVSAEEKEMAKVLLADLDAVVAMEMDKFSGSVFSMAPPPSCLPLPKFSLRHQQRPKLSCNAEAAAAVAVEVTVDGATDNLCKMLRLR